MDATGELRATAHPLRLRMLSLLTGAAMSAAEVGRELGVSQANASYHLRLLERAGLVRVVEEVRVRGGAARRYRHESSAEPFVVPDAGQQADDASRTAYYALLAAELRRRGAGRVTGPAVSTDAELWVPADVWRRVVAEVGQASARLHAAARPPRSAGTIHVSMTAALFQAQAHDNDGAS